MAVYGANIYGTARFGIDPSLVRPDFSIAPFVSTPLDYGTLHLTWVKPQSPDCTMLRLVRNHYNIPQDVTDGAQVFDVNEPFDNDTLAEDPSEVADDPDWINVGDASSFTDQTPTPGFNYYRMFGWSQQYSQWYPCTDLIALLPINWGYGYKLYTLLPGAYRDNDSVLVDPYNPWPIGTDGQPPLQRFLAMLGFEMDFIRSELESLMSINDAQNCSGALLPLLAYQLGLPNEPFIGMQQERQLIQNAVHLYKLKGSARGITEFVSIMTSYPVAQIVHHGYNLLLTRDDSVMDSSIGTWQLWAPQGTSFAAPAPPANQGMTNAQGVLTGLTQIPNLLAIGLSDPTTIIGFTPPRSGFGPQYNNTGMRLQRTGGTGIAANANIDITTAGIPVTDFLSQNGGPGNITFTIQIYSTVARSIEVSVYADVGTATPILLPATPVAQTSTVNGWKQITYTAVVNPLPMIVDPNSGAITQQVNAAYYWLYPRIRVLGAGVAPEAHYVTLISAWSCDPDDIGTYTPTYDYPRDLKIILSPQASNLFSNPLTMFARVNPQYDPTNPSSQQWIPIGFDGWSSKRDPTQPMDSLVTPPNPAVNPQTAPISIFYTGGDDPTQSFAVNGIGSLEVSPVDQNAVVWGGYVQTWTTPAPSFPQGWFADPANQWFIGQTIGAMTTRLWFDAIEGWFTMPPSDGSLPSQYFGLGQGIVGGQWFVQPQPVPNNPIGFDDNLQGFVALPHQPLNYSVYARYMSAPDPETMAQMQIGMRWYFPDGSYYEDSTTVVLTNEFQRYQFPHDLSPRGQTPVEEGPPGAADTGLAATLVYPFVRFPGAGPQCNFLLNSAMLSPSAVMPPYMDFSMYMGNPDYTFGADGSTYYYRNLNARSTRMEQEVYRFIPMGATQTLSYAAGNVSPPIDPTQW